MPKRRFADDDPSSDDDDENGDNYNYQPRGGGKQLRPRVMGGKQLRPT